MKSTVYHAHTRQIWTSLHIYTTFHNVSYSLNMLNNLQIHWNW